MYILNEGQPAQSRLALEVVRYRVLSKPYSAWRAILAEIGQSDTDFLIALRELHGIKIDKKTDPQLFLTQDTQQMRILAEEGIERPTMLQILLTAKVFALSEEDCKAKMEKLLRGEPDEEEPKS